MNVDECYQLCYIIKPHGLQGKVGIYLDVDIPKKYSKLESVFVEINKKLVPFFIEEIAIQGQKATVKFEDIDSIESAENIAGSDLYLPLNLLEELSDDQYYYHEIIGYKIIDKSKGELGEVVTVFTMPNQDLISSMYQGKEILIPINNHIIKSVNKQKKEVSVDLPDGLLDIYLE